MRFGRKMGRPIALYRTTQVVCGILRKSIPVFISRGAFLFFVLADKTERGGRSVRCLSATTEKEEERKRLVKEKMSYQKESDLFAEE